MNLTELYSKVADWYLGRNSENVRDTLGVQPRPPFLVDPPVNGVSEVIPFGDITQADADQLNAQLSRPGEALRFEVFVHLFVVAAQQEALSSRRPGGLFSRRAQDARIRAVQAAENARARTAGTRRRRHRRTQRRV